MIEAEIRAAELGIDAPRCLPEIEGAIYSRAEWEGWGIHYCNTKKHRPLSLEQETGYLARVIFLEIWS